MSGISASFQCISKSLCRVSWQNAVRSFCVCNNITVPGAYQITPSHQNLSQIVSPSKFLVPSPLLVIPAAGMKQMGKLRRRCKHCFFIMIDERLHVWCDVHARHKQMQMISKPKTVIITTHATQGKLRPW